LISIALSLLLVPAYGFAQTVANGIAATASTAVPPLIPYSGQIQGLSGHATATFLIYKDETGGEPLFAETQAIVLDAAGQYKVQLGATLPKGLPTDLFATGEARWLEVQVEGEAPRARVLLVSVPYALKAADAATLGGLPASAFALAGSSVAAGSATPAAGVGAQANSNVTTPGGTSGYLPLFTGAATIGDSIVFQNSNGIGINNIPYAALDVTGKTVIRGNLDLGRTGNPTTATGFPTYPLTFHPGVYNSTSKAAVYPVFQWQAEPAGNNTASPSATFNLLTAPTSAGTPAETGFYFNLNGTIHFAPDQTFPGAGITGTVNATTYELGGALFATGSTSNQNAYLGFAGNTGNSGLYNVGVGYQSLAVNTANDNTAIGADVLLSNTTGAGNTAIGAAALQLNTDGNFNTASGLLALYNNTTGYENTASGDSALYDNTTGVANTAVGVGALEGNTAGNYLTAVGEFAGNDASVVISNATALGAHATVGQSNSLVLGQTMAGGPGASYVNVGIGTATPRSALEVAVSAPNSLGPVLTLTNSGQGGSAIDFNTGVPKADAAYAPAARILASGSGNTGQIVFQSRASQGLSNNLVVDGSGVHVPGALDAAATGLRIDHPADPANKYLVLSSVQSSEMMNIFTGNVVTDELGMATVQLPDWFEAENTDFRYQLTTIGRDAHAWIGKKVQNGSFQIATNATKVEVSWQITAVRRDAFAQAHPLVVEQEKPADERGNYVHPELYGQPIDRQIGGHAHDQPASAVDRQFPTLRPRAAVALQQPISPLKTQSGLQR
jgi:hypothetical protein